MRVTWLVLILILLTGLAFAAPPAEPIRIMIVTGGHSYPPSLFQLFNSPEYQIMIETHPTMFRPNSQGDLAKRYDVLVLYDLMQESAIGEEGKVNLRKFVEAGKGLIVLHHAVLDYPTWDWWCQEVSGVSTKPPGGTVQRTSAVHGLDIAVEVVAKHPVLNGVGPMTINDEAYKGFWISPRNTILLRTKHEATDGVLAWISPYKQSRVFVTPLGHGTEAHLNPTFQKLMRNAVLWVTGRLN